MRAAIGILLAALAVLMGAGAQVAWRVFQTPPDLGVICHAFEPFNAVVLYRLRMALPAAGETTELPRVDQLLTAYQDALTQLRPVYDEAFAIKTLGLEPRPEPYHRLAGLREQMGRLDQARAWLRLVLRDVPDDPLSLAALARLE